jgi:hypothetical protein
MRTAVASLLFLSSVAAWAADPVPPKIAEGAVVRPTFAVGDKKYPAGTAFFVKVGDHLALLTSYGLLGPSGGLPTQLTPAEVAAIPQVTTADLRTGTATAKAGPGKLVADAAPVTVTAAQDLAVFEVSLSGFNTVPTNTYVPPSPLVIATTMPKVGDAIWLVATTKGSDLPLHQAKVGDVSEQALYVDFAEKLDLAGTSGAPFVNAAGQVVGMCVGGGVMEGVVVGAANPATSLAVRAGKALGAK